MRATLVHCECLISRGYYLSAASWFIKMTNDEADLNSGLLLEQVGIFRMIFNFFHFTFIGRFVGFECDGDDVS